MKFLKRARNKFFNFQYVNISGDVHGNITLNSTTHQTSGSLPPPPTDFFLENSEHKIALHNFLIGKSPSLQIHGMSGVGKTTLVADWVYKYIQDGFLTPDEIIYLDLRGLHANSPNKLAALLNYAMGREENSFAAELPLNSILASWRNWCQTTKKIIIYDNLEDPFLTEILKVPATQKTIFISTILLSEISNLITVEVFSKEQTTTYINGVFVAKKRNISEVDSTKIAKFSGNLPLALSAAAGILSSLQEQECQYGLQLLEKSNSQIKGYLDWERRVSSKLNTCIDLLPISEQNDWMSLWIFEKTFFPSQSKHLWANETTESSGAKLGQFANRSICQRVVGLEVSETELNDYHQLNNFQIGYQLHPLFKAIAKERSTQQHKKIRDNYGRCIFLTAELSNSFYNNSKTSKIGAQLNKFIINDKSPAFEALEASSDISSAEFLAEFPIFGIHRLDMSVPDRVDWLRKAEDVAITRLSNHEKFREYLTQIQFSIAQSLDEISQYSEAMEYAEKALENASDDPNQTASIIGIQAMISTHKGDNANALAYNTRALKHWIVVGNSRERATAYNNRGLIHLGTNNLRHAARFLEISLNIDRQNEFHNDAAFNLQNLAQIYLMMGNDPKAWAVATEAEETCLEFGNRTLLPGVYQVQGSVLYRNYLNSGSAPENRTQALLQDSVTKYQKALELERETGRPTKIIAAIQNLAAAILYLEGTGPQKAAELCAEAINLSEDQGIPWASTTARRNLAHIFHISGHIQDAKAFYEDALQASRQRLSAFQHLQVLEGISRFYLDEVPEKAQEVNNFCNEALSLSDKAGLPQFTETFRAMLKFSEQP